MGAEPCPASFEKSPRWTPYSIVSRNTPAPVPATPETGLKASEKMRTNAAGIAPTLRIRMSNAPAT